MMAPVVSALGVESGNDACEHADSMHAWHPDGDCAGPSPSDGHAAEYPSSSGADHPCHCVHVGMQSQSPPALATLVLAPVPPESPSGEPKGPAYPPPVFDFVRPPN